MRHPRKWDWNAGYYHVHVGLEYRSTELDADHVRQHLDFFFFFFLCYPVGLEVWTLLEDSMLYVRDLLECSLTVGESARFMTSAVR